jgi:DNA-binding GntR family transcriptional regulator
LALKGEHLIGVTEGEPFRLPARLRKGVPQPVMTAVIQETLARYREEHPFSENDFLFASRKGGRPIRSTSASMMVNGWFKAAGFKGLSGALTLRKTYETFFRGPDRPSVKVEVPESDMVLLPVQAPTIQERVYHQLLNAIISGQIPPGARLIIDKVAGRMNVSPIPVREALGRLAANGVVSRVQQRGIVVNKLSPDEMEEILQIRLMLEAKATELACCRVNRVFIKKLEDIHRKYIAAKLGNAHEEFLRLNREFHFAIYNHSTKKILIEIIRNIWDRASPYLYIMYGEVADEEYSLEKATLSHWRVIEAMKAGDPRKSAKYIKEDLMIGFESVRRAFSRRAVNPAGGS